MPVTEPSTNSILARHEISATPSVEMEATQKLTSSVGSPRSNGISAVSVQAPRVRSLSTRRAKDNAMDAATIKESDAAEAEADRQKLARLLEKTQASLNKKLGSLETNISQLEEDYISATWAHGNVIRGWDGFIPVRRADRPDKNAGNGSGSATGAPKHRKPRYTDRIFSLSSSSSQIRKDNVDTSNAKKTAQQKKKKKR